MRTVSQNQLRSTLNVLKVRPGQRLMMHAALQYLGKPDGGPGIYLDGLLEAIGPSGTLAAPTFNFAFARGEQYDPLTTPSANMGALAELVRTHPQARRTPHPLQSIAAIGPDAADLTARDTPGAFDPGGPFERMVELDYDLLLIGAGIDSVSLLHLAEQRLRVPYRFFKDFSGAYITPQGVEHRTYRMYARRLEANPRLTLRPVEERLRVAGQWQETTLNYGKIARLRMVDFVRVTEELLREDPYALALNRAEIIAALTK
jgi:aminoglycoside N3'-acetyltransferase